MADAAIEWFQATSARVWGALSMLLAVVVLVIAVVDTSLPVALGAVLFALLAWASMLRPKIGVTEADLLLRNMYSSVRIPLAAIDTVVITRTFAARVIDKTYVSPAIGRSFRQIVRGDRRRTTTPRELRSYADHVEERIGARIADARVLGGVPHGSDAQAALAERVEQTWSWVEIVALVVVLIAFVLSIAL